MIKARAIIGEMWCDHPNECPNVCTCLPNCSCRSRMCEPSTEGAVILSRDVSDNVTATARFIGGDRATVAIQYGRKGVREGKSAGVLDRDESFVFGDASAQRIAESCPGWDGFLEELRSLMPVASVLDS